MNLPTELEEIKAEVLRAANDYGLDFYDVIFEVLDYDQINEVASFGGFPTRYPHWRFGMEYERMTKSYAYGLHKIYEMVINNDPCYAYLLKCNHMVDQKLVMAHVYAHSDFFKNNMWFAHTNRKMIDEMANHGSRIRSYCERIGFDEVEEFIDCCLSLEDLIDVHSSYIRRREDAAPEPELSGREAIVVERIRAKEYMDTFINPTEFRETKRRDIEKERQRKRRIPAEPVKDVLQFLVEYAPLERWQRDVLSVVREESYYFAPQMQTKIMNEGWAAYWHSKMMTERLATTAEIVDYADHHSGTTAVSPGRLNPYKVGLELFRNIEERWNRGQFGPDWDRCDDARLRRTWDRKTMLGRQKIFEVRKVHNDITFIDEYLTPEFCEEQKLFQYRFNPKSGQYEIASRDPDAVKQELLLQLTNFGKPFIYVTDANYGNRGELYLKHRFEGVELRLDWARDTLRNLHKIWGRPVNIETIVGEKGKLLSFDGNEHKEADITPTEDEKPEEEEEDDEDSDD